MEVRIGLEEEGGWGVYDVAYSDGKDEEFRDGSICGTVSRDGQTIATPGQRPVVGAEEKVGR